MSNAGFVFHSVKLVSLHLMTTGHSRLVQSSVWSARFAAMFVLREQSRSGIEVMPGESVYSKSR